MPRESWTFGSHLELPHAAAPWQGALTALMISQLGPIVPRQLGVRSHGAFHWSTGWWLGDVIALIAQKLKSRGLDHSISTLLAMLFCESLMQQKNLWRCWNAGCDSKRASFSPACSTGAPFPFLATRPLVGKKIRRDQRGEPLRTVPIVFGAEREISDRTDHNNLVPFNVSRA